MKKVFTFSVILCASIILSACAGNQEVKTSDVFPENMLIVYRVYVQPNAYGTQGAAWVRSRSGEEIRINGNPDELEEVKYLQPGDTLFFRKTKTEPDILRVGFKD